MVAFPMALVCFSYSVSLVLIIRLRQSNGKMHRPREPWAPVLVRSQICPSHVSLLQLSFPINKMDLVLISEMSRPRMLGGAGV